MITNQSVSRLILRRYVNLKIKRLVLDVHVMGIITILFDEMLEDLKAGKEIKIHNLGILNLQKMSPRKYFNFYYGKVMFSTGHKVLRFFLKPTLNKKLRNFLDVDKTFKET